MKTRQPSGRAVALLILAPVLAAAQLAGQAQDETAQEMPREAYCYLREVQTTELSNGVQIQVKADGILEWRPEGAPGEVEQGEYVTEATIRFPRARLALDQTLYQIDKYPVSTMQFWVPQDSYQGLGVVMKVSMTEPSQVRATLSEDRQSFLLTVLGQRTVERGPGRTQAQPPAPSEAGFLEVTARDGLLWVRAVKADIHKVVAEIAQQGGLSVAVDDAVQHRVSLNLAGLPALEIIRSLAAGYGLALSQVQNVYMLSEGVPTDLPTYRRSDTGSFPMQYLKARDAAGLLPTFLFKYVHDNPEQNAVVVTAPSQMLDKIRADLQAIDLAPPMILVEAAAVELSDTSDLTAGLSWLYQSPQHEAGSDSETGEVKYHRVELEEGLATAIADTAKLQARLRALVTQGKAVIHAHPRMAAVNGKEARIFIGQQRFIKVTYLQWGQQQERIETVPVGVELAVRPWTGGDGEITTWLRVEVSNISELDPETGLPTLSTRRAATTVRTRDGDTIVIGGLLQRQGEKTYRRLPLLSNLPVIGPLFRSQLSSQVSKQLVILVRPRLLNERGQLPPEEEAQLRARFLQPGDLGYPSAAPPAPRPAQP
jgi:hypothetical protein